MTTAQSLAWRLRTRGNGGSAGVRILYYHRVSRDTDPLAIAPARFRRQMERLAELGFEAVDVMEAAAVAAAGENRRIVGLTFDDGYRDVADHALPVLEEHGFRATVFVATSVVDGSARFAWYDVQPPVLTWDEIVDLDARGTLRFEAHTRTHPNLLAVSDAAAEEEIAGSKSDLEDRLGRTVDAFCYPAGLYRRTHRDLAAAAGFRVAVTCDRGANDPGADPLLLRRTGVDGSDRMLDFDAKLAGGHDAPLPFQRLYRRLRYGIS